METKFTPSPWRFTQGDAGVDYSEPYCQVFADDGEFVIADINDKLCRETGKANGQLIAASPKMYGILEKILNSDMAIREEDEGRESAILNEVRAILMEARGESETGDQS